jgi:hypothetical protein
VIPRKSPDAMCLMMDAESRICAIGLWDDGRIGEVG